METIDQFTALAAGGKTVTITMQQVPDDNTWFEVYASDEYIGKVHWRADTDGYMAQQATGEGVGSFQALTEAEDALIHAMGYYPAIATPDRDVDIEPDIPSVNDHR